MRQEDNLEQEQQLDAFLAGVERRALRMAELATQNQEDALELVQEAMFGLVKHYAKRPPETWPPLFHRILQNRIRDWRRHNILRQKLMHWFGNSDNEQDCIEAVPDPHHNDPFHHLGLSDAGNAIVEALRQLPLRQQQVFMLRAWEGLSVQATAQAMGCSAGSVKTHFSRANRKLKTALEDYWP